MTGDLVTAGFWRRVAAGLLDTLAGMAAWGLCAAWLVIGFRGLGGAPREGLDALALVAALIGLAAALRLAWPVVFVGGCGQTPGRMALGIAVVDAVGRVPGYGRAALRVLGTLASGLSLGLLSLPVLLTQGRGLGDWLAGTRVVLWPGRTAGDGRLGL